MAVSEAESFDDDDWEPSMPYGGGCEPEGALLVAMGCIVWTAVAVFALVCVWLVLAVARWAVS